MHLTDYMGESKVAGAAYRCDRCGAHWYPEMGERPPARCIPTPDYLRANPEVDPDLAAFDARHRTREGTRRRV